MKHLTKALLFAVICMTFLISCRNTKSRNHQKEKEIEKCEILAKTDSLASKITSKILFDTVQVIRNEKGYERIIFVENKPDEGFWTTSTIISLISVFISITSIGYTVFMRKRSAKDAITKEFIELNSLTISHPYLKLIYKTKKQAEAQLKILAESEVKNEGTKSVYYQVLYEMYEEKLQSYCYKYLNLLDFINNEYKILDNRNNYQIFFDRWLFRKRTKNRQEWRDFFSNNFPSEITFSITNEEGTTIKKNEETMCHYLLSDILNRANFNGAYSKEFIDSTIKLFKY